MYKNQKNKSISPGVLNFIINSKKEVTLKIAINQYNDEEIGIGHGIENLEIEICNEIQKDFGKFVK